MPVDYSLIDPQYASDQLALQRKMQLAQALREQSMQGAGPTQYAPGGFAIQQSPLEGIAKMFQGYTANKLDQANDARRLQMAQELQSKMGGNFDQMFGGASTTSQSVPLSTGDLRQGAGLGVSSTPSNGPLSTGYSAPDTVNARVTTPANDQQTQLYNAAKSAYMMGNTDLANKLIENRLSMTPEVKNWLAQGINPSEMRAATLAKALKEGTMSLTPGQTNILPSGQRIVAPDFSSGIQGGFDTQGRAVMGAIPGAGTIASLAGSKAAEEAAGRAAYTPQTVTLPNGRTVLASQGQLIASAKNGGLTLQNPDQAAMEKAKAEAQIESAKMKSQADPLLNVIQQARTINEKVPYGPFGIAEGKAAISSLPGMNPENAKNAALWDQMMGQSILNTITNLASSGGIRMDIPIVKEIQKAGGIPMSLPPQARAAMLDQLESEIKSRIAGAHNITSQISQAPTSSATQMPMVGNPSIGGAVTHPDYPGFSIAR